MCQCLFFSRCVDQKLDGDATCAESTTKRNEQSNDTIESEAMGFVWAETLLLERLKVHAYAKMDLA